MTTTTNENVSRPVFSMPMKPYSAIDAINRIYAATGSVGYAVHAASADYNGHANGLSWNDYRSYYVGEYYWGERCVWFRGTDFAAGLSAAVAEFDSQGKGATLVIHPHTDADVAACRANSRLIEGNSETAHKLPDWWTWQHSHASTFVRFERMWGGMDAKLFIEAASYDDWYAKVQAELDARRARPRDLVKG